MTITIIEKGGLFRLDGSEVFFYQGMPVRSGRYREITKKEQIAYTRNNITRRGLLLTISSGAKSLLRTDNPEEIPLNEKDRTIMYNLNDWSTVTIESNGVKQEVYDIDALQKLKPIALQKRMGRETFAIT